MRAIGAQKYRVQLLREIPVGGVPAGAGDETKIFAADRAGSGSGEDRSHG
jgi:hypothetical protein